MAARSSPQSAPLPAARVEARAGLANAVERAVAYGLMLLVAVIFLTPLVWTLSTSLKDVSTVVLFPPTFLPDPPHWENYVEIFRRVPFALWIANSVQITLLATLGTVVSATLVAYSFARFRYPGRDLFFFITVATLILPTEVTIVPTYLLFRQLGWLDSFRPLIVPAWLGGGAFYIFLLRQFFLTLPREFDEAAKIDGANSLQTLLLVLLPLSRPALTAVVVISFISHWDEFFLPLVYLNTPALFPLSLGLRYFQSALLGEGQPMFHLMMAGAAVATIPPIALFIVAQRYFVQGVVMSGIKA
jgi:ABC-type glycerol-3-phosphate transport system permease component